VKDNKEPARDRYKVTATLPLQSISCSAVRRERGGRAPCA